MRRSIAFIREVQSQELRRDAELIARLPELMFQASQSVQQVLAVIRMTTPIEEYS